MASDSARWEMLSISGLFKCCRIVRRLTRPEIGSTFLPHLVICLRNRGLSRQPAPPLPPDDSTTRWYHDVKICPLLRRVPAPTPHPRWIPNIPECRNHQAQISSNIRERHRRSARRIE
jgi:hypothetical protein